MPHRKKVATDLQAARAIVNSTAEPSWPVDKSPAEALAVHCADPRFQSAFRHFITGSLGFRNYVPIVAGGGVHALALRESDPRTSDALWQQIDFMVTQFKLKEILIFGHSDCRWYQLHNEQYRHVDAAKKARIDLPAVARLLQDSFPGTNVRCYWAEIDGDSVIFSEVR